MKTNILFSVCILVFSFSAAADAQNQLKNSVVGSGGGVAANGSYRTLSTVGQAFIGTSGNASTAIHTGFWFQNIDIITIVEQIFSDVIPEEFRLEQNYPNPFNPTTTIEFAIPHRSAVTLKLYDVLGREIDVLVDEEVKPGVYKVAFQAQDLPSGIYFYRIQAEGFVKVRKLTLLK